MRVTVLASGSRGNALAITANGFTLLLDAGLGPRTLRSRCRRAAVDLSRVDAVLLSHEHGDHARSAAWVAAVADCPVYASAGTLSALEGELGAAGRFPLLTDRVTAVGPFAVSACRTSHDAAEPLAFTLESRRTGARVGIAADLGVGTAPLRRLLAGVQCLVIEANHDPDLLARGPYPASLRRRIAGPGGHLSNAAAAELAADLCHPGLETVILAHLSERCNRPNLALAAARDRLAGRGFTGRLLVARQAAPLAPVEVGAAQFSLEGLE
jgi:phosphoribosyl 1,2-cyclic phosphodiesterase